MVVVVVVLVLLVEGSKLVVIVVSAFLVFDMLSLVKIHILVGTISIKRTRTARKRYVSVKMTASYIHKYIHLCFYLFTTARLHGLHLLQHSNLAQGDFVIIGPCYNLASIHSYVLFFSSGNGPLATGRCREKRTQHQPLPASARGEIQILLVNSL